jgi:hypothetical protein
MLGGGAISLPYLDSSSSSSFPFAFQRRVLGLSSEVLVIAMDLASCIVFPLLPAAYLDSAASNL